MQSLQLALLLPPPPVSCSTSSAYEHFMQKPYHAADHLQSDGGSFTEWVAGLNHVLCVAFNSEMSVDDSPSLLDNRLPQENRAISHFIDVFIPQDRFQKLKIARDLLQMLVVNSSGNPKSNTSIVLSIRRTFAMFKKLNIKADKLEELIVQKGNKKPSLTFVSQVIINASQQQEEQVQVPSLFVYWVSEPQDPTPFFPKSDKLHNSCPMITEADVRRPPDHLFNKFGASCFHCGRPSHWQADCLQTWGMANPNPRSPLPTPFCPMRPATPDRHSQQGSGVSGTFCQTWGV
ncbi:hypothetical protein O181_066024 [Austropuccinia psidii MF-1]|uniref:CCHC-type domain-containing protein n=1 Tax=Austropuccinia psidii MF-1 TaxID=1389203 RepID=A0A9Q3ESM9_9BASI|nr:hypothetical protein [Austropuccinia psidii MF-1]